MYHIPFGRAHVVRPGSDATIITYGLGVHWAMEEAAWQEEARGVQIEVVDLRTLVPWDREAVLESVSRTSRVLVLHEATATCGFGAEVSAVVAQDGFHLLDAPPVRVAAEDLPVPFSLTLEHDVFAAKARLRDALLRLLAY